jgi:hypothetical protein
MAQHAPHITTSTPLWSALGPAPPGEGLRPPEDGAAGGARALSGPRPLKLSILMPAYNEERTLRRAIRAALSTAYPCEIELIVVDDGSTDRTPQILGELEDPRARVERHPRNLGKGAALSTAAAVATGTHIVPFDADFEYSPADLPRMLAPVLEGRADVVYGTRLFGVNTRYQSYRHGLGNRALTVVANVLFDAYLNDLHTCLKLMPLSLFRQLELRETGFGLDSEVTAGLLKLGIRPFEVPVTYHSRSSQHGKKITWRDGMQCLRVLGRVRFRGRCPQADVRSARVGVDVVRELAPEPLDEREHRLTA